MASAPPEHTARVLGAYPELRAPRLEPLGSGLMHQTYAVHDPSGEFVLQRVHPMFSLAIHVNIQAVTCHLRARGIPSPRLVPTRDERAYVIDPDGRCWRLFTRIAGFTVEKCPDAAHARSAAALMARFHAALSDLEHDFRPLGLVLHDTPAHLAGLERALRELPQHPLHAAVLEVAAAIRDAADQWSDFGNLPRRPAHGDPKFNNVLFHSGTSSAHALIDLDTVGPLPLFAELGDAWRSWCNRMPEDQGHAELDLDLWRAAAEGYLDATSLDLDTAELRSLAEAIERISLELAARFAEDVLRESYFSWDPERFERSGEHQLRRARTQLDLHRQARDSREDRLRFLLG